MSTENNNQGTGARDIPTPPGGGSWTFDEQRWEWVSNDPAPTEEAAADSTAAIEQPAAIAGEE